MFISLCAEINADISLKENEKQNIEEDKKECLQSVKQPQNLSLYLNIWHIIS